MINIQEFDSDLLKIDKKNYKSIDIYYFGYIAIKKINDCKNISNVNLLIMHMDILKEKMEINTSFLKILLIKTKSC